MGVAAVLRLGGGDTELFSACFCSVKFWLVFTSLPASSKCYPMNVGRRFSRLFHTASLKLGYNYFHRQTSAQSKRGENHI